MPAAEHNADQLLSKTKVLRRAGWTSGRLARELGGPDEVESRPGGVAKMYSLQRVEAAEAAWETPDRPSDVSASAISGTVGKRKKRRKRRKRIAPDVEDAMHDSMLAQFKDGISDEELAGTTFSQSELHRRGWTATLIRDLLGEPAWLTPNPKYPNSAAPMKLWDRQVAVQLERSSVWHERRSRRAGTPPLALVSSISIADLALEDGWHTNDGKTWKLLGSPLFPRALAVERSEGRFLMVLPPIEGDLACMWDAGEYAAMIERLTGEKADLRPLGDAYEKCSQCGCPLAHHNEVFKCPSCGHKLATADLDDAHKALEAVLVVPDSEQALLNAARAITTEFLRLQQSRWLPAHQRK